VTQERLKTEFKASKKEIDRLIKNRNLFYEAMSDLVFIFDKSYRIQDMNQSARNIFGDLRGNVCFESIHNRNKPCGRNCPIQLTESKAKHDGIFETAIGQKLFTYSFAPYTGYHGDELVMLVMQDVTKIKSSEKTIENFNTNISRVLQRKINEVKETERIREQLSREVNVLKKEMEQLRAPDQMVGDSKKIRELREMIYQVADTDATILITGESGSGKELVADLVHKHSSRDGKPYLKFNCASVTESLLESDLFGYEKGAFTGANTQRKGKFEIADTGTIFLDEIGDISPKMQSSLLRVLQNGEIIRVGGATPIRVDVRVIAATNSDLNKAVKEKRFRKDLFYRLNVINLHLPPLRERKDDIVLLITHFIKKYRKAFNKDIKFLPKQVLDKLLQYDWPGNIRELENAIQRAILLSKNDTISSDLFVLNGSQDADLSKIGSVLSNVDVCAQPIKKSIAAAEKNILWQAMIKYDGNVTKISEILDMGKSALYGKLKKYRIRK
jgi:transcriptional regulator with PAS, ATPase and Fis domain